ncbi:hypothetical protein KJ742_03590 [Patescibacteria group bacterium]|nr:hypothetical protein [Patescibacteria group bacterium]MBU1683004.1 hypothetical protein [Patescibacteria group bacterium]
MKIKTKLLPLFIISIVFAGFSFFASNALALDDQVTDCPTSNPAGTVDCLESYHYAGGLCRLDSVIEAKITDCEDNVNGDGDDTFEGYLCSTHNCACPSGYRDCRGYTNPYNICLDDDYTDTTSNCSSDANDNRTTNPCNNSCTSTCIPGYEKIDGSCEPICPVGYTRGHTGKCYSVDEFQLFEFLVDELFDVTDFGLGLLTDMILYDDKEDVFQYIATYLGDNPDYFLLTATGGPTEDRAYEHGSANPFVWLVADWADTAWQLVWYDNEPTHDPNDALPDIIQEIIEYWYDFDLCRDDADCPADNVCYYGFCHADGDPDGDIGDDCDTDFDCLPGFICGALNECVVDPYIDGDGAAEVQFVGITVATYDGNDASGYGGANNACDGEYSGSHVCTVNEILTFFNNNYLMFPLIGWSGEAWINGGPPGYTADANDCIGWSSASGADFGKYWDFNENEGWMRKCGESLPFACCE